MCWTEADISRVHGDPFSPFEPPHASGVVGLDCRDLNDNAITELVPTLFDKLTNLVFLYVTLMLPCITVTVSGAGRCIVRR